LRHTPGPWKADIEGPFTLGGDTIVVEAITEDGKQVRREICTLLIDTEKSDDSPEALEDKANAKLIEAGPEMLEAIKDAHAAVDWLFASLASVDRSFFPSQSPVWAPMNRLAGLIRRLDPDYWTRKETARDGSEATKPV
jgi:hypothetical protein